MPCVENICKEKITKVAINANIKAVCKCKPVPSNSEVVLTVQTIK